MTASDGHMINSSSASTFDDLNSSSASTFDDVNSSSASTFDDVISSSASSFDDVNSSDTTTECPLVQELTRDEHHKLFLIEQALNEEPVDVKSLRRLAIGRSGLVTDEVRRRAWPVLLGVHVDNIPPRPDEESLVNHRDYRQVVLDVSRSLRRFPPGMKDEKRLVLQDQMVNLIMAVLVRNDELYYYQGYHDICVTILLVVGDDISFILLDKLSLHHLRGFMDMNMERTRYMLSYLYPLLARADQQLCAYMERAEVGTIFALSWLITWYGHVLSEFRHIVRLYDFFIACHPLMPIYLAAAIVLHRRDAIYATECEMCYIHSLLSMIPDDLPYEELITIAGDLYIQFPPKALVNEATEVFDKTYGHRSVTSRAIQQQLKTRNTGQQHTQRDFMIKLSLFMLTGVLSAVTVAWWTDTKNLTWWW